MRKIDTQLTINDLEDIKITISMLLWDRLCRDLDEAFEKISYLEKEIEKLEKENQ